MPADTARGSAWAALLRLAQEHPAPRLSIDDLVAALGNSGFGLLLLALALPNLVPGPFIPGFSLPFALGVALLGTQLARGAPRPRLPSWLGRRSIGIERVHRLVRAAEPRLERLERFVAPRPSWLTEAVGRRLVGGALVALGAALALPVPLGNSSTGLAIGVVALGLLAGDGRAIACGLGFGVVATAWSVAVLVAGGRLLQWLLAP
jgi:hypothetical protein